MLGQRGGGMRAAIMAGAATPRDEAIRAIDVGPRVSQMDKVLERSAGCLDELEHEVLALETRLAPVLDPVNVQAMPETDAPHPVRCPVAGAIDASADRVFAITTRVRDLLARLAT
jgi:hypothetical protein